MDVRLGISKMKFYRHRNWFFYFKKYVPGVKGFIVRFFGIHINIREWDATNKLIALAKKQRSK